MLCNFNILAGVDVSYAVDQCKPWDPIGIANECTLINTIFCEPDDGRTRPKHVA